MRKIIYPLEKFVFPSSKGSFGIKRKFDIHTGIDFYCPVGSKVFAMEDGIVVAVENFTGQSAGSPWWNETKSVLVEGKSGVICYGEIEPTIKPEDIIKSGTCVGTVLRVLKKSKGFPTSMLHLELYKHGTKETLVWKLNELRPDNLLDPNVLFSEEKLCQKNTLKMALS